MDKLNCKLQAHVRVCKENKLELELDKSDAYWNNFVVKDVTLKGHAVYSGYYAHAPFTLSGKKYALNKVYALNEQVFIVCHMW